MIFYKSKTNVEIWFDELFEKVLKPRYFLLAYEYEDKLDVYKLLCKYYEKKRIILLKDKEMTKTMKELFLRLIHLECYLLEFVKHYKACLQHFVQNRRKKQTFLQYNLFEYIKNNKKFFKYCNNISNPQIFLETKPCKQLKNY